jgi:hypothetical protein
MSKRFWKVLAAGSYFRPLLYLVGLLLYPVCLITIPLQGKFGQLTDSNKVPLEVLELLHDIR